MVTVAVLFASKPSQAKKKRWGNFCVADFHW